jgi:hypothetical protein
VVLVAVLCSPCPQAAFAQAAASLCAFRLESPTTAPPRVIGPDWFIPLVHVQNQPDSPLEIVTIDYNKTRLSLASSGYTHEDDYVLRVRNRSDRNILRFDVTLRIVNAAARLAPDRQHNPFPFLTRPGFEPRGGPIGPGQTLPVRIRSGAGSGSGPEITPYRVVVTVSVVEFEGCFYQPSIALPKVLQSPD